MFFGAFKCAGNVDIEHLVVVEERNKIFIQWAADCVTAVVCQPLKDSGVAATR